MARPNDLGRDPVGRLVLRLAIPSMLAQFVNVLYSIVDRMYIGNIPEVGDAALAGAGVCGPIVTLISSFAFLIGVGGAPLMAMSMGAGDNERARRILSNCGLMLAAVAAVVTPAVLLCREPMLMAFGASAETFPYADSYLTVYVLGTAFAILSVGLNQFIICQGFSGIGMATVLIGAALNIALDPVFIFVLGMGVSGAAAATVISQAASFVFVLCFLQRYDPGDVVSIVFIRRDLGFRPVLIYPVIFHIKRILGCFILPVGPIDLKSHVFQLRNGTVRKFLQIDGMGEGSVCTCTAGAAGVNGLILRPDRKRFSLPVFHQHAEAVALAAGNGKLAQGSFLEADSRTPVGLTIPGIPVVVLTFRISGHPTGLQHPVGARLKVR